MDQVTTFNVKAVAHTDESIDMITQLCRFTLLYGPFLASVIVYSGHYLPTTLPFWCTHTVMNFMLEDISS